MAESALSILTSFLTVFSALKKKNKKCTIVLVNNFGTEAPRKLGGVTFDQKLKIIFAFTFYEAVRTCLSVKNSKDPLKNVKTESALFASCTQAAFRLF